MQPLEDRERKIISIRKKLMRGVDIACPCRCLVCGLNACKDLLPVCSDCIGEFYRLMNKSCPSCGKSIGACCCEKNDLAFVFWYTPGISHRLISYIKNDADVRGVRFLAEILAERIKELHKPDFDAVTFVPRRKRGIRVAGYDQAKLVAQEIAPVFGVKCVPMLNRHGSKEQKLLSAAERRKTMQNRYSVITENVFSDEKNTYRKVLLIDDVSTTGATINACAALLRKSGIKQVIPAVIAKTPKKG